MSAPPSDPNALAFERLQTARALLVDLQPAAAVIPGMTRETILHAGPPLPWDAMVPMLRGAIQGALVFEGLARDLDEAATLAASGAITFGACNDRGAVGPLAGVVSASMPTFVVQNGAHTAYATINEGLGQVLRYGANGPAVLDRLRWLAGDFSSTLQPVIQAAPVDLLEITASAVHMGDECHNRNRAATSLLLRRLAPLLADSASPATACRALETIDGNDHFFLNLSMAASKAVVSSIVGIPDCPLVTTMARNGQVFGIQIAALPGRWFTAPVVPAEARYFEGYSAADACPDLGDSAITETNGLGGFAMAAAPALVRYTGGTVARAMEMTLAMYDICAFEHPRYTIPALEFRGTPYGIDVRRVAATGITPFTNTGIAHRLPGYGQIGAGYVRAPLGCFAAAAAALT